MDGTKLCFFEETSETDGNYSDYWVQHGIKLIFVLATQKSSDEIFGKIYSGKWIEIIESEDFERFLDTGVDKFEDDRKLGVAVACLLAFIQENFTGPDLFESSESIRFQTICDDEQEKWKIDRISIDGIELNANIRNIALLVISRNFLDDLDKKFPDDLVGWHLLHNMLVRFNLPRNHFSSSQSGDFAY